MTNIVSAFRELWCELFHLGNHRFECFVRSNHHLSNSYSCQMKYRCNKCKREWYTSAKQIED